MTKKKKEVEDDIIPTISEESSELGTIRINHSVVAGIVRLATQSVNGVVNVGGGGVVEGLTDFFSKKESERGVKVTESANVTSPSNLSTSESDDASCPDVSTNIPVIAALVPLIFETDAVPENTPSISPPKSASVSTNLPAVTGELEQTDVLVVSVSVPAVPEPATVPQ